MTKTASQNWLMVFYSVPSQPVSTRIKIWRKLAKVGAVPLKGAVYILPDREEHVEFLQWLVGEVKSLKGDAAFVRVNRIESVENKEVRELFNQQRGKDYRSLDRKLEDLERRVQSVRKGTRSQSLKSVAEQTRRLKKELDDIQAIDFFGSTAGKSTARRFLEIESVVKTVSYPVIKGRPPALPFRSIEAYQAKTWVTRKKPFVDRMASAWFIRRFIDSRAVFRFIEEREMASLGREETTFDIRGGDFTHEGDLCTFEVFVKSFAVKDKAVGKIAEIVHDLDIKDKKYGAMDAPGVEEILTGIRKIAKTDDEALEKGITIFEMLFVSKT